MTLKLVFITVPLSDGDVVSIRVDHISEVADFSENACVVGLTNGRVHEVRMNREEFLEGLRSLSFA